MKENLIRQIAAYNPYNEQESTDKALLLEFLKDPRDLSCRQTLPAHLTASAWVVTPDRSRVLMAYHNIYDSWAWLGGHADGNWNLAEVAEREAREESGIDHVRLVTPDILSLEILTVSGHEKKGSYVPSHLHLNLTYLFEADPGAALRIRDGENSAVGWIPTGEIAEKSTEAWFVERIYSKLTEKAARL